MDHLLILSWFVYIVLTTKDDCDWNFGVPGSTNTVKDSSRRNLIVGGSSADEAEYGWQAHIHGPGLNCGGSLIHQKWVVTAAHCCSKFDESSGVTVSFLDGSIETTVKSMFVPSESSIQDVCLLHIDPVPCDTAGLQAIQIVGPGFDFNGCAGFVTGYGKVWHQGPYAQNLQELFVTVMSTEVCNNNAALNKAGYAPLFSTEICAFDETNEHKDTCVGDSGSPLLIDIDPSPTSHQYALLGSVSYGYKCGYGIPTIYQDLSKFKDWILEIIGDEITFVEPSSCDTSNYAQELDIFNQIDGLDYVLNSCELWIASQANYNANTNCGNENCALCTDTDDCLSCKAGFEINVMHNDCTGMCVPKGTSESLPFWNTCDMIIPCLHLEQPEPTTTFVSDIQTTTKAMSPSCDALFVSSSLFVEEQEFILQSTQYNGQYWWLGEQFIIYQSKADYWVVENPVTSLMFSSEIKSPNFPPDGEYTNAVGHTFDFTFTCLNSCDSMNASIRCRYCTCSLPAIKLTGVSRSVCLTAVVTAGLDGFTYDNRRQTCDGFHLADCNLEPTAGPNEVWQVDCPMT